MSAVKDDARRQAAESEKAKELAVEEAVTRVRRQLEESMSENYRCACVCVFSTLGLKRYTRQTDHDLDQS